MRTLIVSHYVPHFPGPGGATREYCLARELAKKHEITYLLPPTKDQHSAKVSALTCFCNVRFAEPHVPKDSLRHRIARRLSGAVRNKLPFGRQLSQLIGPSKLVQDWAPIVLPLRLELEHTDWNGFDLIQIEHTSLAPVLRGTCPVPRVLDWLDLHSCIRQREYQTASKWSQRIPAWADWRKTVEYERQMAAQFDRSIVMSELDALRLRQLYKQAQVSIVPNGVDCDYFYNSDPGQVESETLVFTGLMDYEPNVEGVLFFCEQVLPLLLREFPHIVLYIVGARPTADVRQLADRYPGTVIVTGAVDDVRPYIQRAAVSVVPLLNGGGTRLKILEAMSMQKAVVSTSVGCEGLKLTHGDNVLSADTVQAFAQATKALLLDENLRNQLALNGQRFVREHYDWKLIAKSLEQVWQETLLSHREHLGAQDHTFSRTR